MDKRQSRDLASYRSSLGESTARGNTYAAMTLQCLLTESLFNYLLQSIAVVLGEAP
jgi:hypothetical protein